MCLIGLKKWTKIFRHLKNYSQKQCKNNYLYVGNVCYCAMKQNKGSCELHAFTRRKFRFIKQG